MRKASSRCPHVATIGSICDDDLRRSISKEECHRCRTNGTHLWLCLRERCLFVGCGSGKDKSNHSSEHEREMAHPLQMNLTTKRIWCHSCSREVFIDNDPHFRIPSLNEEIDKIMTRQVKELSTRIEPPSVEHSNTTNTPCPERSSLEPKFFDIEHSPPNKNFVRGTSGLINLGNTCYMNAALQSLSNCVPLTSYLIEFSSLINNDSLFTRKISRSNRKLLKSFVRCLESNWMKSSNQPLSPNSIVVEVGSLNPSFRCYQQQDAQEFLRCFMDELHEEMSLERCSMIDEAADESQQDSDESDVDLSISNDDQSEYESCSSDLSEIRVDDRPRTATRFSRSDSGVSLKINRQTKKKVSSKSLDSMISSIFDGFIQSEIECLTCSRRSKTVETFQDLSLPIPSREQIERFHSMQLNNDEPTSNLVPSNPSDSWFYWLFSLFRNVLTLNYWSSSLTLQDCLQAFFEADQLTGDNMYSCEKCRKLRNGVKYCRVIQLPEVLCIHLKRFRHDSMIYTKISHYVSFPLFDLDMSQFVHKDCPSEIKQYDLFSVIVHYGRAGSGHYVSYCLNHFDNQWYEYDDEHVRQVDSSTVQNCEAYVLFYRKKEKNFSEIYEELGHLFNNDQSCLLPFYISRSWINRLFYFAEPGPIRNDDVLCKHGGVYPSKWNVVHDLVCSLPQTVWFYLVDKYGGPSSCNVLYPCSKCQIDDENLKRRQRREKATFVQLTRTGKETDAIYGLSPSWYKSWENFVLENSSEIPGPIRNESISTNKSGTARLIRRDCNHLQVNESIWKYLQSIYGGGPEILIRPSSASSMASVADDEQENVSTSNERTN